MKIRLSFCLIISLLFLLFSAGTTINHAAASGASESANESGAANSSDSATKNTSIDSSASSEKSDGLAKDSTDVRLDGKPDAKLDAATARGIAPLKGYAKHDARGTPVVPEWKLDAGYDALLGKFYVGVVGLKLFPISGPPPAAVLGPAQLKHWSGHKPHPCLLKFTKLQDTSGGFYFQTIGSETGPRGWIIPQPAEPHKAKEWAIYFMQEQNL